MAIDDILKENAADFAKKDAEKLALAGTTVVETPVVETVVAKKDEPVETVVEAKPTPDAAKLETAIDSLEDDEAEVKPDEKGAVKMPFKQFERRIQRAAKASLKAIFGTDNRDDILKMKKDYEKVLTDREEERRAKLAAEDLLKEDLAKEKKRANELETKWNDHEEAQAAEVEEKRIGVIASKYIDEDSFDLAHYKFAKHLKKKTEAQLDAYTDEDVEKWYKSFAEKHPKFAKEAKAEPKKAGLNVGAAAGDKKPSPKTVDANAKSVKEMTPQEWSKYKRAHGISY